jgi:hypothetical protein
MQVISFSLDVDYRLYLTRIIHKQTWGFKVEDKIYLGLRKYEWLNTLL